jgi:hypothetical protein
MASKKQLEALLVLAGRIDPSLQKAFNKTNSGINGIATASTFMGKTMSKAFDFGTKAVAAGTALAGAALTYIATKGLSLASDLNEVQNVVNVTFGNNSKAVDAWSETTLKSFGLSELSAKQYSSTMGAMLKSSGLSANSILTMSENLTGLSGDFASFYNKAPADMFEAIQSGISGETEPLKRLGINMSVANMEAYALSKGIKTSYSQLDQASQMTLRYNYLLDASKDAQGDFARTQGELANQTRLAKEKFHQLAAKLMTAAVPGFTKLLEFANKLLDGAMGNPEFIRKFQDFISKAMDKVVELTPQALAYLSELGPTIKGFYDFAVDTYNFINNNWPVLAPIIGGVAGSLLALELAAKGAMIIKGLSFACTAAKLAMDGYAVGASAAAIAQDILNLAWKTCPVGVVITAIGLLIAGGIAVYKNWDKLTKLFSDIGNWFASVGKSIGKFFGLGDKSVNLQTNFSTTSSGETYTPTYMEQYATGGFANRPSVFGEAGPEAAIPLKYKNPRSISLLNQTASAIGANNGNSGAAPHMTFNINLNGPVSNKRDVMAAAEESSEYIIKVIEDYYERQRGLQFG